MGISGSASNFYSAAVLCERIGPSRRICGGSSIVRLKKYDDVVHGLLYFIVGDLYDASGGKSR